MMDDSLPRIGVVICGCGGAISGILDSQFLLAQAEALPGVVWTSTEAWPCSKDGLERLAQAAREHNLERVLVAGCAPKLVEKLFRRAAVEAGLDPGRLEVLDIREGAAMPHASSPALAEQKAATLIRSGVARLGSAGVAAPRRAPILRQVAVIGSDLAGVTAALSLADRNIPVVLLQSAPSPGEPRLSGRERELVSQRLSEVAAHPLVRWIEDARVVDISGDPGLYHLDVTFTGGTARVEAGAVLVATRAVEQPIGTAHRYNRAKVRTLSEFDLELERVARGEKPLEARNAVWVLCEAQMGSEARCSRLCCLKAIRQAARLKELEPDASATILFRELFLGKTGLDELRQAREQGVSFFRWQKNRPPVLGDDVLELEDELTGSALKLPFDRAVLARPFLPEAQSGRLAALLGLPEDSAGFLLERRFRLRPERLVDDGIFVLGGAHAPSDTGEILFQAYLTASRAAHWIEQGAIHAEGPVAQVDQARCTGCGSCAPVCPTDAIAMERRPDGTLSLSGISQLRCIGCGACMPACPTRAISLPGWEDKTLLAQIEAALHSPQAAAAVDGSLAQQPRLVAMLCEWGPGAAAALAGARKMAFPAHVIPIRVNCSARFDPYHVLWALLNGADGVLLGACPPGECHYGQGNRYAKERIEALRQLLDEYGIDHRRVRLEFISGDDGVKLARAFSEFAAELGSPLKVA